MPYNSGGATIMRNFRSLALATGMLAALPAQAADIVPFGEEKFEILLGGFLSQYDTTVEIDEIDVGSIVVDLEDDLDFDDNDATFIFDANWRFLPKHSISVGYFTSERNVNAVATGDIPIGEETIPAGVGYSSDFNMDIVPLQYTYSFINDGTKEFYGSVGLHWASVDFKLATTLAVVEQVVYDGNVEAEAPMPLVGIGYDHYINPKWKVGVTAEGFYIKLSEDTFSFEGSILNLNLGTEYMLGKNFAIGATVSWFSLDVDIDDDDWNGALDYSYWGPAAYIKARF
jgi:hypothetical protein